MSRIVFILGAGASQDTGAPLMADFLDRARDWMDSEAGRDDCEPCGRRWQSAPTVGA